MRKIAAFLLSLCISACFVYEPAYTATAYAPITPYYQYAGTVTSTLHISDKKATCTSELTGGSSVTKVSGVQYLQKKGASGSWSTISGGTWSKTVNDYDLLMSNTKSGLSSGTYRLKTVFTVYSGKKSESIEKISSEATV